MPVIFLATTKYMRVRVIKLGLFLVRVPTAVQVSSTKGFKFTIAAMVNANCRRRSLCRRIWPSLETCGLPNKSTAEIGDTVEMAKRAYSRHSVHYNTTQRDTVRDPGGACYYSMLIVTPMTADMAATPHHRSSSDRMKT